MISNIPALTETSSPYRGRTVRGWTGALEFGGLGEFGAAERSSSDITTAMVEDRLRVAGFRVVGYRYATTIAAIDAAISESWGDVRRAYQGKYPDITKDALPPAPGFNWAGFVSGVLGIAQRKWMETT